MEGKLLQRRRNLDMIAMDLKAIWEMSARGKCLLKILVVSIQLMGRIDRRN
mgnify:CR=1 FL=1